LKQSSVKSNEVQSSGLNGIGVKTLGIQRGLPNHQGLEQPPVTDS